MSSEKQGEPGTVAVDVGGKAAKGTYKAELGEKPPRLRMNDVGITYIDPQTRWGMQSLLLDVSRTEDNTILFVTHDVSEAVYLADSIYVLAARPTHILHRVDVPFFENRDIALKSSNEFRNVEKKLLDLLYAPS